MLKPLCPASYTVLSTSSLKSFLFFFIAVTLSVVTGLASVAITTNTAKPLITETDSLHIKKNESQFHLSSSGRGPMPTKLFLNFNHLSTIIRMTFRSKPFLGRREQLTSATYLSFI